MIELLLLIAERTETIEQGVKFTLHGVKADGSRAFGTYCVIDVQAYPTVAGLKVGDTVRLNLEPAPPVVQTVESTIENAERGPRLALV